MVTVMVPILPLWILDGVCLPRGEGKHRGEVCLRGVELHIHVFTDALSVPKRVSEQDVCVPLARYISCDTCRMDLAVAG